MPYFTLARRSGTPAQPRGRVLFGAVLAACCALAAVLGVRAFQGASNPSNVLVSVNSAGNGSGGSFSFTPVISPDGRYVAFTSAATNLTTTSDANASNDVFLRDMQTNTTRMVSVNSAGTASANGSSTLSGISSDGRYVAFTSTATNIMAVTDANGAASDVFVRDMQTNATQLISITGAGTSGNALSDGPVITPDGRYVAFRSRASNLVGGDTNGFDDIFVRDRATNTTTMASAGGGNSTAGVITPDGRYVAYQTAATVTNVFLRDRSSLSNRLVSVNTTGSGGGNSSSFSPSVSSDGRYVAFSSSASDLVTGDTNGNTSDVFVRDMTLNTTRLLSLVPAGNASGNGGSFSPEITPNGRYVVFESDAFNLTANDAPRSPGCECEGDVFVRDTVTNTTQMATADRNGGASDTGGFAGVITPDGRYVAFESSSGDLANVSDTNNFNDAFVRDMASGVTRLVSVNSAGAASGNSSSFRPVVSSDGRYVAFWGSASDLVANDTNGTTGDVFRFTNALPGQLQFSASTYSVGEAGPVATITVTRTGGTDGTVTVNYATSNGTATAGSDYTAASGTLTFGPGVTTQTFNVNITNDASDEPNETVNLTLSTPTGGAILGTPSTAVLTVTDNDAPTLTVSSPTVTEGNSGPVAAVFTISLIGSGPDGVSGSYEAASGTAGGCASGCDFVPTSGTFSLQPGQSQQVTVQVNGDTLDESDETFFLLIDQLQAPNGGGVGTILDDDAPPSLSVGDATVTEGNTGTVSATFNVTLSAPSGKDIQVNYATADGTATAGSDYTSASGTLTFTVGQTSKTVTVVVNGDTTTEANETFFVNLSGAANATIADGQGTGTITNDDAPSLRFSSATYSASEGAGTATITVNRDNGGGAVSVTAGVTGGTATAGSDYTFGGVTLSFAAGESSKTFDITITDDALSEGGETVSLALSNPTGGATLGTPSAATFTINDNEGAPSLTINDVSLTEGNSGPKNFVFTVTLSPASASAVTVNYATADGTAAAGSDYTSNAGQLTFNPGDKSISVTVVASGDTTAEADETFFVNLSGASGASIADPQGVGTITNDDSPSLRFDSATYSASEGSESVTVTVLRDNGGGAVSVNVAATGGTATAGSDYSLTPTTLNFAAGESSKTFSVLLVDDALLEGDETVQLTLSGPTGGATLGTPSAAVLTITDNEAAAELSIGDATVTEGNAGTVNAVFTVTLSPASASAVTVNYATANGTAAAGSDYAAAGGTLTFNPGETSKTVAVQVNGDTAHEADETFTVNLSGAAGASVADGQGLGLITNDDLRLVRISGIVTNGGAPVSGVPLTLSGSPAEVRVTGADGRYSFDQVLAGRDYTVTALSPYYAFVAPRADFPLIDSDKVADFVVNQQVLPAGFPDPSDTFDEDGPAGRDPDRWNLGLLTKPRESFDPAVLVEEKNMTLVVTPLSGVPGSHFNGYVSVRSFDLTGGTVSVQVLQAAQGGAETSFAIGEDSQNFFRFVTRGAGTTATAPADAENAGRGGLVPVPGVSLFFQVRINGVLTERSIPYDDELHKFWRFRHAAAQNAILFETSPNDVDYTERDRVPLTKGVSALVAELSAGTSGPVANPGQAVFNNYQLITNTLQFAVASLAPGEHDGTVTLNVTRLGSVVAPSSVHYETSAGTASAGSDFVPSSGTLQFAAGEQAKSFTVQLADDTSAEGAETFEVFLTSPSGSGLNASSRAVVTISDDDTGQPVVQFSSAAVGVVEPTGLLALTVQRTGDLSGTSTVSYATASGTATDTSDFMAAYGTLTFAPGQASKTLTIFVTDDRYLETPETFTVALSVPTGATLGTNQVVTATVTSEDAASGQSPVKGGAPFDPQFFVRQHYRDFLNRDPDAAGLAFWAGQTTGCGNSDLLVCRINVSAAFFLSPEFQDTGFFVIRMQRVAAGRRSDSQSTRIDIRQFIREASQVGEGFVGGAPGSEQVLEANRQVYATQVVQSPEFVASFPASLTAGQYVEALFAKAGIAGTVAERQAAVGAYNAAGGGTPGRVAALRSVAESSSVRDAEFRTAFVLMQYFGYMRRDPDQLGYDFWLGKLNEFNGDYVAAEMVKAFITSAEYEQRFGQ